MKESPTEVGTTYNQEQKENIMAAKSNEVKPGWKTTEFWLTSLTVLASLLWGADLLDAEGVGTANKVFGFVVAALGAVGYTVSRGMAKGK